MDDTGGVPAGYWEQYHDRVPSTPQDRRTRVQSDTLGESFVVDINGRSTVPKVTVFTLSESLLVSLGNFGRPSYFRKHGQRS